MTRPSARLWMVAALTALVHGVLIGAAWQSAAKREPPRSQRVALRLLAAAPAPAARSPQTVSAPVPARRSAKPAARAATQPPPDIAPPVAAEAEVVTGIAIGFAAIPFPGSAPKRWVNPQATAPSMAPPPPLGASVQAQAAREAGRAQLDQALQQQLANAAALPTDADGACALPALPEAQLACDNALLQQALAPRESALSGLVLAYRSMEPRASGLAIAVVQGRYRVSWTVDTP